MKAWPTDSKVPVNLDTRKLFPGMSYQHRTANRKAFTQKLKINAKNTSNCCELQLPSIETTKIMEYLLTQKISSENIHR